MRFSWENSVAGEYRLMAQRRYDLLTVEFVHVGVFHLMYRFFFAEIAELPSLALRDS